MNPSKPLNILMALGSDLSIPPKNWGGAENVIWQQKLYLESQGHKVSILNPRKNKTFAAIVSRPWRYDFVHLHLDRKSKVWTILSRFFGFKVALTSHYGYAAFPQMWETHNNGEYKSIFKDVLHVPNLIVLSPEIRDTLLRFGCKGRIFVLPNGITTANMQFNPQPAPKGAILLGKIEDRKKQKFLARVLQGYDVQCDLIGPNEEPPFLGNGENVVYRGTWTREVVQEHLTDYAVMALISDGEAHAGVLLEAMAAGLSLVVSPECAHNLDTSQPWVYVIDRDSDDLGAVLQRAVQENSVYRAAIREYCEKTFDWSVIGPQYLSIINDILSGQ